MKLLSSVVQIVASGEGGTGHNPEPEWVEFDVLIPLDPKELDAEARRYLARFEAEMTPGQKAEFRKSPENKALENIRQFVYQNRVGHFQLDCRILDGSRVLGAASVELEVLFKGRFSDVGLPASPPA